MKGTDILLLRRSLGLTQQQFGQKIGKSRRVVSKLENREFIPAKTREQIARIKEGGNG